MIDDKNENINIENKFNKENIEFKDDNIQNNNNEIDKRKNKIMRNNLEENDENKNQNSIKSLIQLN